MRSATGKTGGALKMECTDAGSPGDFGWSCADRENALSKKPA